MTIADTSQLSPPACAVWSVGDFDTVTAVLSRARDHCPDKVFVDFGGDTYTYAVCHEQPARSNGTAGRLRAAK